MQTDTQELAVLCPVFNEEKTTPLFFERLKAVKKQVESQWRHRILRLVFIDNHSSDATPSIIKQIANDNDWVGYLRLSKNFGYQRSVESGLRSTLAQHYCIIDVDCEDPPEMILDFLKEIENGYEVVYGERVDREEPELLKWARKQFYRITKFAADEQFNLYMAEFSLFSRIVRDALIQDNNSFPFFRASIARVGFDQKAIPYKRHPRIAGVTHYNFFSMFTFGLAGNLSSSTLLLRLIAYLFVPWFLVINGLFVAATCTSHVSFCWCAVWISLIYIGFSIMSIAIYIARIYKNTLFRPNYFIDRKTSILRPFMAVESR